MLTSGYRHLIMLALVMMPMPLAWASPNTVVQARVNVTVPKNAALVSSSGASVENAAIPMLKDGIAHSEKVGDYISRELFEKILESEEEHVDWLETQLDLIERMGLQNYVQLQSGPEEKED